MANLCPLTRPQVATWLAFAKEMKELLVISVILFCCASCADKHDSLIIQKRKALLRHKAYEQRRARANSLLMESDQYARSNEYEKAISNAIAAIKIFPEEASLYTYSGELLLRVNRYKDAEWYFQNSLKLKPQQQAVLLQYGMVKLRLGDAESALRSFKDAEQMGMQGELLAKEKCLAYLILKDFTNALLSLEGHYSDESLDPATASRLSVAYAGIGAWSNAIKYASYAEQYEPGHSFYSYNLTQVLLKAGRFTGSVSRIIEWANEVDPSLALREFETNTNMRNCVSVSVLNEILQLISNRQNQVSHSGDTIKRNE